MSKTKFTLAPSPTFKAPVDIPVPGAEAATVEFTFKHKTRDQFAKLMEGLVDRKDEDVILEICEGWELSDEFNKKSVALMNQNYMGSARAVIEKYINELAVVKLGN